MTDSPSVTSINISDPHQTRVEFCNQLAGSGYLSGVVNITLAQFRFTPTDDGKIDPDLVICSRLRMDITCAMQLRDALNKIIEANVKPANGTTH